MASKRAIKLMSIPVRIGAGLANVFIAWKFPYIAAALLLLALFAALCVSLLSWLTMLLVRQRGRTDCARCEYRPLAIARICPHCHTPLLVSSTRNMSAAGKELLAAASIAMAWADGAVGTEERELLNARIDLLDLPAERKAALFSAIDQRVSLAELPLQSVPETERVRVLEALAGMMLADGVVQPQERELFFIAAKQLTIPEKEASKLLRRYEAVAVVGV